MNSTMLEDAIELMVFSILRDQVSTIKPAIVTKVNYTECSVNAKPLTKTLRSDDKQIEFPESLDIPIIIMSANKGQARITFPIKQGDTVLLLFSDREFGELLDSDARSSVDTEERTPFGYYPIAALPCFFTRPNATQISSTDVVIDNGSTNIVVQPSGQVIINTPAEHIVNASQMIVNCPLQVNATIDSTQTITSGTDVIATTSVTAGTSITATTGGISATVGNISAGGNISSASTSLDDHTHDVTGIQTGSSTVTSQAPN